MKAKWILAVAVCAVSASAAGGIITFQQIDWLADGGGYLAQDSDWGRVTMTFENADLAALPLLPGLGHVGYVNVVTTVIGGASDNWAVENFVLAFDDIGDPALADYLPEAARFDLGVPDGTDVPELDYLMVISDQPLDTQPTGPMAHVNVAAFDLLHGGFEGVIPGSDPEEDFFGGSGKKKSTKAKNSKSKKKKAKRTAKKQLPEKLLKKVKEAISGCAPAAAARSLKYLDDTSDDITIDSNAQEIYEDLLDSMDTDTVTKKGTKKSKFASGKDDYVADNDLLIETEQKTDFDEVMDDIDDGADVEIMLYWGKNAAGEGMGGHAAFVSQIVELMDGDGNTAGYQVTIIDDATQGDGLAANDKHTLYFDTDGNLEDYGTGAVLVGFQVEKVIPEPATLALLAAGGLSFLRRRRR